jgi:hypothetical protein
MPVNSPDFNRDGSLDVGKQIALQLLPPIEGFLCVLVVESGGRVTVLYPNDQPAVNWIFQAPPSVPYDFNKLSLLDLKASAARPAIFVLLVSASPRPLSAFVPREFRGEFFKFDGLTRTTVDPARIGPGWLGRVADERVDNVEDSPETWAAYNVIVNVVDRQF